MFMGREGGGGMGGGRDGVVFGGDSVYFHIRELCNQEAPHLPKAHSDTQRERRSFDAFCTEDMFGQIELAGEASTPDNNLAIK